MSVEGRRAVVARLRRSIAARERSARAGRAAGAPRAGARVAAAGGAVAASRSRPRVGPVPGPGLCDQLRAAYETSSDDFDRRLLALSLVDLAILVDGQTADLLTQRKTVLGQVAAAAARASEAAAALLEGGCA